MTIAPHVTVTLLDDDEPVVLFDAFAEVLQVGRHPRCTVRIGKQTLSPWHAELVWRDGMLWVTDHDAVGGTAVDDTPVLKDAAAVPSGSIVRFGRSRVRVEYRTVPRDAEPRPRVVLTRVDGERPTVVFDGPLHSLQVGRHEACRVRLHDVSTVGSRHAELVWRDDALWVIDYRTSGGTDVNGAPVTTAPVVVASGSTIRFGDAVVQVEYASA